MFSHIIHFSSESEFLYQKDMSALIKNRCLSNGNCPAQLDITKLKAGTGLKFSGLWFVSAQELVTPPSLSPCWLEAEAG